MYKVRLHRRVQKFFQAHSDVAERFYMLLPILEINPYSRELDVKRLQGKPHQNRLRIGKYRLIFRVNGQDLEVLFLDADGRGGIYK